MEKEYRQTQISIYKQQETRYMNIIARLITKGNDFTVKRSTLNEDLKESFDMIISYWDEFNFGKEQKVSVRIRNISSKFNDITIRTTEYNKLLNSYSEIYFYGWKEDGIHLSEYVLIDVNKFKSYCNNLTIPKNKKLNKDGTSFYTFDLSDIKECIIERKKRK